MDISCDEGKNWTALKPSPQDVPDADKKWNALSLPFLVGPNERIGKLRYEGSGAELLREFSSRERESPVSEPSARSQAGKQWLWYRN